MRRLSLVLAAAVACLATAAPSLTYAQKPAEWKVPDPKALLDWVEASIEKGVDSAVDAAKAWNKTILIDAALHTAKTNPCKTGYMMDAAGKCTVCDFRLSMVPGCNACVEPGTCTGCGEGYKFVAAAASPNTLKSGMCICDTAHIVDPNCAQCAIAGSCDQCYNGYFPDPATKVCVQCSANCRVCDSATACNVCAEGYSLDGAKQCVACKAGCLECNDGTNGINTCRRCKQNLYPDPANPGACIAPAVDNCLQVSEASARECGVCASGYTLTTAKQCDQCKTGCAECNTVSVCKVCTEALLPNPTDPGSCTTCKAKGCLLCAPSDATRCLGQAFCADQATVFDPVSGNCEPVVQARQLAMDKQVGQFCSQDVDKLCNLKLGGLAEEAAAKYFKVPTEIDICRMAQELANTVTKWFADGQKIFSDLLPKAVGDKYFKLGLLKSAENFWDFRKALDENYCRIRNEVAGIAGNAAEQFEGFRKLGGCFRFFQFDDFDPESLDTESALAAGRALTCILDNAAIIVQDDATAYNNELAEVNDYVIRGYDFDDGDAIVLIGLLAVCKMTGECEPFFETVYGIAAKDASLFAKGLGGFVENYVTAIQTAVISGVQAVERTAITEINGLQAQIEACEDTFKIRFNEIADTAQRIVAQSKDLMNDVETALTDLKVVGNAVDKFAGEIKGNLKALARKAATEFLKNTAKGEPMKKLTIAKSVEIIVDKADNIPKDVDAVRGGMISLQRNLEALQAQFEALRDLPSKLPAACSSPAAVERAVKDAVQSVLDKAGERITILAKGSQLYVDTNTVQAGVASLPQYINFPLPEANIRVPSGLSFGRSTYCFMKDECPFHIYPAGKGDIILDWDTRNVKVWNERVTVLPRMTPYIRLKGLRKQIRDLEQSADMPKIAPQRRAAPSPEELYKRVEDVTNKMAVLLKAKLGSATAKIFTTADLLRALQEVPGLAGNGFARVHSGAGVGLAAVNGTTWLS